MPINFGSIFQGPGSSLPYTPINFRLGSTLTFRVNWQDIIGRPTLFPYDFNVLDTADINLTFDTSTSTLSGLLTTTGVAAGTYGSTTETVEVQVDDKGRVTDIQSLSINFPADYIQSIANTTYINLAVSTSQLSATLNTATLITLLDSEYWQLNGNTVVSEKWFGTADNFSIPLKINNTGMGIITASGMGIGMAFVSGTTQNGILEVTDNTSGSIRGIVTSQYSTSSDGARIHFRKARGTRAAPTTLTVGDTVGRLRFEGYDGSNYLTAGDIHIQTEGSGIVATSMPTQMTFSTMTNATPSVLTEAIHIDSAQQFAVGVFTSLTAKLQVRGVGTSTANILLLQNATPSTVLQIQSNGTHTYGSGMRYVLENNGTTSPSGGESVWQSLVITSQTTSTGATSQWRYSSTLSYNNSTNWLNYFTWRVNDVSPSGTGNFRYLWINGAINATTSGQIIGFDFGPTITSFTANTLYGLIIRPVGILNGFGLNATMPVSVLELGAGTTGYAPFKLNSGTNTTTAVAGAWEYDGSNFYATATAGNRRQLVRSNVATPSNGFLPIGNGTDFTLAALTAGTGITITNGAGTITVANSYLTGSATLDFPSTAAQSSSDLTITVTGAALNDVVSVGVPNGSVLSNSDYTAWASAADTVTVRFNNYSSGAQDPASGTFKVIVFK
jgi:hypothetical protein